MAKPRPRVERAQEFTIEREEIDGHGGDAMAERRRGQYAARRDKLVVPRWNRKMPLERSVRAF